MLIQNQYKTLLVNITHPEHENTFSILQNLFQEYGKLQKMIITNDQENQKILVEFNSPLEAQTAYKNLNHSKQDVLGEMHLNLIASPPDFPKNLLNQQQTLKDLVQNQQRHAFGELTNLKNQGNVKLVKIKEDIRYKGSLKTEPKKKLVKGSVFVQRMSLKSKQEENPFYSKIKPSKVVLISNLENNFQNSKEIFNLFSCFGNIKKVLFMKNLQKAMVEYYQLESALCCAVNINNLKMDNQELRINYSKYKEIDLEKNNMNKNSITFNEVYIPCKNDHRYDKYDVRVNVSIYLKVTFYGELLKEDQEEYLRSHFNGEYQWVQNNEYRVTHKSLHDSIIDLMKNHGTLFNLHQIDVIFTEQFNLKINI